MPNLRVRQPGCCPNGSFSTIGIVLNNGTRGSQVLKNCGLASRYSILTR